MDSIDPKKLEGYEKSLRIMKNNVSRVIAVTLFSISCLIFLVILWLLVDSIFITFFSSLNISENTFSIVNTVIKSLFTVIPMIFIYLPIELGIGKWFYEISNSKGKNVSLTTLFYYFNNKSLYFKSLNLQLDLLVRKAIIFAVCLIPAFVYEIWYSSFNFNLFFLGINVLRLLDFILIVAGLVFAFVYNLKYFMVKYLFFNKEESNKELFFKSDCIMRIRKKEVVEMYLSFFPFYILSVLIVPIFFMVPYMVLYFICMAKEFMGKSMKCN